MQAAAWTRIVDYVHRETPAKIGLQLGHAGPKGATRVPWEGENEPLCEGGWPLIAPTEIAWSPKNAVPRPMTRGDMDRVRGAFVPATGGAPAGGTANSALQPRRELGRGRQHGRVCRGSRARVQTGARRPDRRLLRA